MIPSLVIELARQNANVTLSEIGDGDTTIGTTRAYQYLQMVKDELWAKFVASNTGKDLSWEEWTQDLTAQQSEYVLPQVVVNENRIKKIQSLAVCYNTEKYTKTNKLVYNMARYVDRKSLDKDWSWYEANQSPTDPIYYVSDKAIFVAPISTSTVIQGLKLTGVKKIPDYDENTTEDGMVIPDDYHYLLVEGLEIRFLQKQGARQAAAVQKQDYQATTREALDTERDTQIGPMHMRYPDTGFETGRTYGTNTYITLPY